MKALYPIGAIVALAVVVVAILTTGGSLQLFLSVQAFVMVGGLTAAMLMSSFSPRVVGRSFRVAMSGGAEEDLKVAVVVFTAMQRGLLWSGLLATMLGVVVMLGALGDVTDVTSGVAIALITVFYGILLTLVVALPFRHAAERRLASRSV